MKTDKEYDKKKVMEMVFNNLVDGLILLDNKRKIITLNSRAEKYFNVRKKRIVDKKIDQIKPIKHLNDILKQSGRRTITETEAVFKSKDGKETFINIVGKELRGSKRKTIGYIIIAHDITREKIVDRLKNEFISIAAHQLRTPLSAINWILEAAISERLGKLTNKLKDGLEKANYSNERMIALINDLLNVSRIEEGRFLYKSKVISIEELVKTVVLEYSTYAGEQGVSLTLKMPDRKIPKLRIDPDKISLAIRNLLDNAIKYSGSSKEVEVRVKLVKKKGRFAQIAVKDGGIGIKKKDQEKLYQKFFRAENAIKTKGEGTGLGLFIVRNIIEDSGGRVWFRSKERKGTTFYIELPLKRR